MQEVKGKYTTAIVMSDTYEDSSYKQILTLCNQEIFKDTKIRIMPDFHAGAGCVIGFTMPITNFIIPNLIGVDIGCGIDGRETSIDVSDFSFKDFDKFVKERIPSGFGIHKNAINTNMGDRLIEVANRLKLKDDRILSSIGTLGGGNHFIELGVNELGKLWLFLHSGSRNFGLQIARYYQQKAQEYVEKEKIIGIQKGLEYLPTDHELGQAYIRDMTIAQVYASLNRDTMANILTDILGKYTDVIKTTHNYINPMDKIIRKGAIQADWNQKLIIPLNMRDGVIVATGKGNLDWNNSAPHGAGRILARGEAKRTLSLDEFRSTMSGVYSSCINNSTIDESPMAYKPKEEILNYIDETLEVNEIIKPVYNFKAPE